MARLAILGRFSNLELEGEVGGGRLVERFRLLLLYFAVRICTGFLVVGGAFAEKDKGQPAPTVPGTQN